MALIEVNHQELRDVADAADEYCRQQESNMNKADAIVGLLLAVGWRGADADELKRKWSDVNSVGSASAQFRESIEYFGECLRSCAKEYQNAQADSYSEAYRLPR